MNIVSVHGVQEMGDHALLNCSYLIMYQPEGCEETPNSRSSGLP